MARKIISWTLIILSATGLLLSGAGIAAAWICNEPLTRATLNRLDEIDTELELAQTTLQHAQQELEHALDVVHATEEALDQFTQNDPQAFFEDVQTTLDDELLPELETARERLISARDTLENVRVVVFGLNIVPFIQVNIPDQMLTDLIDSAESLETQIKDVGDLAAQASVLLNDASQLFGGDLGETRDSLEGFLASIREYQQKLIGWRGQVASLKEDLPTWIDRASISLTIFLLWFGLAQFSLLLHGRALLRGENPWEGFRK